MAKKVKPTTRRKKKKKQRAAQVLSTDLHERILAHLPMRSLCRAALVCKAWHQLLFSPPFHLLRMHLCPSPSETWILLDHVVPSKLNRLLFQATAWDFRANVSYTLNRCSVSSTFNPDLDASSHGLVCNAILPSEDQGFSFSVINPVTLSQTLVPPTQFHKSSRKSLGFDIRVKMVVDPCSGAFELIVFDYVKFSQGELPAVELFDSRTGSWQIRHCSTKLTPPVKATKIDFGYGSFIERRRRNGHAPYRDTRRAWAAYDHGDKSWVKLNLPPLPNSTSTSIPEFVFLYKEHITMITCRFLVSSTTHRLLGAPHHLLGFEVWQLQQQQWVAKSSIYSPENEVYKALLPRCFTWHAAGDVVCLVGSYYSNGVRAIAIDLVHNSCYVLPIPEDQRGHIGGHYLRGLVFQPSSIQPLFMDQKTEHM